MLQFVIYILYIIGSDYEGSEESGTDESDDEDGDGTTTKGRRKKGHGSMYHVPCYIVKVIRFVAQNCIMRTHTISYNCGYMLPSPVIFQYGL